MRPRTPDVVVAAIIADLRAGTPRRVVADRYGVSASHVSYLRHREGLHSQVRRLTAAEIADIVASAAAGESVASIAERHQCDENTVRRWACTNATRSRRTPRPDDSWREQAACTDHDLEMFFPQDRGDAALAKAICQRCPVIDACLDWAFATNDQYAVLGGTSAVERRHMKRNGERS